MMNEPSLELPFRVSYLLKRKITGTITPEEQVELDEWTAASDHNSALWAVVERANEQHWKGSPLQRYDVPGAMVAIERKIKKNRQQRYRWSMVAAAALFGFVATGIRFLVFRSHPDTISEVYDLGASIPPGTTQARLVMDNGNTIGLDAKSDSSFNQGMDIQVQRQGGTLSFEAKAHAKELPVYNTLITPKGGEYKLALADGTIVWLNAASSIRFPNRFTGKKRTVQLTGEAYFEVSPDPGRPFAVEVNGTVVQVLGTAFDIKAYHAGETYTALINGAVKVGDSRVLQPGEMATAVNGHINIANADLDQVMAWRNKQIILRDADIRDMMEELSRWYNIDVVYADDFKGAGGITVEISREVPLNKILEMIMLTKSAKFKIEGNTATVLSYR